MEWPGNWKFNRKASAKAVREFAEKAATALKVEPGRIPADYLAFLEKGNGASVRREGVEIKLEPIKELLEWGEEYEFIGRGWLFIGRDGGGGGYGIDLKQEPAAYFWASYIAMEPRYLGKSLEEFLVALDSGTVAPSADAPAAAIGGGAMIAETSIKRAILLGWTPEANVLYGLNGKHTITEADVRSGKAVRKYEVPIVGPYRGVFNSAAVSADGKLLAGALRPRRFEGGALLVLFERASGAVRWTIELGECRSFREHGGDDLVGYILFSPDAKYIVYQAADKPLHTVDAATGAWVHPKEKPLDARGDSFSVSTDPRAAISADGKIAVIGTSLSVYDGFGNRLAEHPQSGEHVSWSDDGSTLVVTTGAYVRVIDGATGTELHTREVNGARAAARLLSDGRLVALDSDGIRVWSLSAESFAGLLPEEAEYLFTTRSGTAATWSLDQRRARLWRLPHPDDAASPGASA